MSLGKEDIPKLEQFFRNYEDMKGQLLYRRYNYYISLKIQILVG